MNKSLRPNWKYLLLLSALFIVSVSLWYTNNLSKNIAQEERKKVELWASAYKNLNLADENTDISFLFEVIKNNETVPVIMTDADDNIIIWRNLDSLKAVSENGYLQRELVAMKSAKPPLEIEIAPGEINYIHYKDSFLLTNLKYYPYIQLGIISLFLLVAYIAFTTTKTAEQNRLWVGMAKETAHQLGTPISSLSAWVELMKIKASAAQSDEAVSDIEKDIRRLELVAERFSKIGSAPKLEAHEIKIQLEKCLDYIKKRSSNLVSFEMIAEENIQAEINAPLFDWVLENLLKNALDAIEGKGGIKIGAWEKDGNIYINITDTGKGIPKSKFKTVFEPGYSTKKRGWGLGLALSKRIIEQYHGGKIFVKTSSPTGTTFEIVLKKK